MSIDQAIKLWPQLKATGPRRGSPATLNGTSQRLDQFMTKAKNSGRRVAFMTLHVNAWLNVDSLTSTGRLWVSL